MPRTMFVAAKYPVKDNAWYFGVLCRGCGKAIALFEDHSQGRARFPYEGEVLFVTVCPNCPASSHQYRSDEVRSYQPPGQLRHPDRS